MAVAKQVRRNIEEIESAEERNPLLKLSLGDLVREIVALSHKNPDVLRLEEQLSNESVKDYLLYQNLIHEINRREEKYLRAYSKR